MTICEEAPPAGRVLRGEAELAVLARDLAGCDRDSVGDVLAAAQRLRSYLDAVEVRAHRRLRELADVGGSEPAEAAVAGAAGGDSRHGRNVSDREEVCNDAPSLEDALDDGDVSGKQLDAIATAARDLPVEVREQFLAFSDELIRRAGKLSLDQFRRECRRLAARLLAEFRAGSEVDELNAQREASKVSRWADQDTGMCHTMIVLDPVRDAEIERAVAREVNRLRQADGNAERPWKQLEVEAWVNCLTGKTTHAVGGRQRLGQSRRSKSGASSNCGCSGGTGAGNVDRAPQIIAVTDIAHLQTALAGTRTDRGHGADSGLGSDQATNGHRSVANNATATATRAQTSNRHSNSNRNRNSNSNGHRSSNGNSNSNSNGNGNGNGNGRRNSSGDGKRWNGVCQTSDGIDLPVETLRRMCCEAEIIPVVMEGPSKVLDVGRSKRTATIDQRHALRAMHSTCAFPGCGIGFESCRVHHVEWWTRDVGPTDMANLIPVCEHHHHLLHEGGWSLHLDDERNGTWTRPDGTVHHTGPTTNRTGGEERGDPGQG